MPQVIGVGFVTTTKVVRKEQKLPANRIRLRSLPQALTRGVPQNCQNTWMAAKVSKIPTPATLMAPTAQGLE